MANGKRRANWEKVLEERLGAARIDVSAMVSDTTRNLHNQLIDLQNEVHANNKESLRDRYIFAIVAILGILTAVLK